MNRLSMVAFLIAFPGLCWPVAAQDQKIPVVAVFEIENRGSPLSGDHLITLTDYLSNKLGERGKYRIIPRREIRARLTEQKKESFKACYEQSCQIEIGRELAAEFTVSSSIGRVGTLCLITASMYDLRKAATAKTATAKGPCQVEQLVDAIEEVADKLQGEPVTVKPKPKPIPAPPPPKKPRRYIPPRAPVAVPPPKPLKETFSELALSATYITRLDGTVAELDTMFLGALFTFDIRLGDLFTMGMCMRVFFGGLLEFSGRVGALVEVSPTLLLHPYALGGYSYTTELAFEGDRADAASGFHIRGGVGIKWMFSPDYGLSLDVIAGYISMSSESSDSEDDGQAFEVGSTLGLVVGW